MNVTYISLDEIKNNASYEVGLSATVYGDDGSSHTVEHNGVARHLGDNGMEYIANAILNVL